MNLDINTIRDVSVSSKHTKRQQTSSLNYNGVVCAHYKRYMYDDSVIIDFVLDFLLTIAAMYFFFFQNLNLFILMISCVYWNLFLFVCLLACLFCCLFSCLFTCLFVCHNSFWLMAIQFRFSCNKGHPWPRSYLSMQPALSLLRYKFDSYPWRSALVTNLRDKVTSGAYEFTPDSCLVSVIAHVGYFL